MKKVSALLIVILICASLFAHATNKSNLTVSPGIAIQHIQYNDHYLDRSTVGPVLIADYYYDYDEYTALGGEITSGYFNYKDFHSYFDTRLVAQFKFRMFRINLGGEKNLSFYYSAGVGVGIGVRDDKDWGVYGVVKGGLSLEFAAPSGWGGTLGVNALISFQGDQSAVAQYCLSLGVIIPLGGKR